MLNIDSNWTIPQCVLHWAQATPTAIAAKTQGEAFTYSELASLAARYADWLQSFGVKRGMVVGINIKHNIVSLLLVLAAQAIRAVPMFIPDSDLSDHTVANRCALLLVEGDKPALRNCRHAIALDQGFLNRISARPIKDLNILRTEISPEDISIVFTSSGTTASSKYIPLSQNALRLRLVARLEDHIFKYGIKNIMSASPFSGAAGMQWGVAAFFVGGCVSWDSAEQIAEGPAQEDADKTMIVASPFVAQILIQTRKSRVPGPLVRLLSFSGADPSPGLADDILRVCAKQVQAHYSCTEVSGIAAGHPGQPKDILPGTEVRIVDNTGIEVPFGITGFIELRSARASSPYLWDPELAQKHFVNGWFRTFDVGYMPNAGKLVVIGRGDDVLNIGGVKIAPNPIEDKIKALDGISDAVLLALPSAEGGDTLHVVIERTAPANDAVLIARVQKLIPEGKFQGHFIDMMPRTNTGKVQRNTLRNLLLQRANS